MIPKLETLAVYKVTDFQVVGAPIYIYHEELELVFQEMML